MIAKTEKGHGVSFLANREGWHGKALSQEEAERAIAELGGPRDLSVTPAQARGGRRAAGGCARSVTLPDVHGGDRDAEGVRGDARGARRRGPTWSRSTARSRTPRTRRTSRRSRPIASSRATSRSRTCSGWPSGCRCSARSCSRPRSPRSSRGPTTSSAWRRSAGRTSGSPVRTPGVSIGEDGPSQMALEDLAMMRAVHGSTVLYPVRRELDGRARRGHGGPAGDLVHPHDAREDTGRSTTPARRSPSAARRPCGPREADRVTLVGAGITVHEALGAAEALAADGIAARVLDCYSIKPIDAADAPRRPRPRPVWSSRSRTTGSRADSATRCSRRWRPTGACSGGCVQDRGHRDAGLGHAGGASRLGRDLGGAIADRRPFAAAAERAVRR